MVKIPANLQKTFKDGSLTAWLDFILQVQVLQNLKNDERQYCLYPTRLCTYLVGTNIDRQSYKYTSKTSDEQKTSTKKLS